MLAVHITARLINGEHRALQMLAPSTAAALEQAFHHFGDQLRGASARVLALRAPGLVLNATGPQPARAANDERFERGVA